MKELWSLARDASVAVGAYVGMVRDRFWAELSNSDSFDETLARAKARREAAADALADKEAQTEAFEPDELWRPSHPTQTTWTRPGFMYGTPVPAALCADRGAPCSPICDDCRVRPETGLNGREERHAKASTGSPRKGAVEEPRVATGPPHGTPGRVDSEVPPVSPSPSGQSKRLSPWDLTVAARFLISDPTNDPLNIARRNDLSRRLLIAADELSTQLQQ